MAEVVLEKVEKEYPNGFKAVHGIDLKIRNGEFMVLVGPSGCAKSTTLRMIAGLEELTGGNIFIGGERMNNVPPKSRGIAMVFQNYALYPHMTAYQNMAFGLKMRKIPKAEIDTRVKSAAEKLEVTDLLDRRPKEMSGGQRQRIALGRAMVRQPEVFLFDEPLSNLDAKLRVSMRVKISQLHNELGSTMVYVTHDQTEAMTMGDRICVLKEGRIMQCDTPLNLYNRPANRFVAGFIGSPAMNFLTVKVVEDHGEPALVFNNHVMRVPVERSVMVRPYIGKNIILGIRPENIHLAKRQDAISVSGRILVKEEMGHEMIVYFDENDTGQMIARLTFERGHTISVREKEEFVFDMEQCHLFDAETEESILG